VRPLLPTLVLLWQYLLMSADLICHPSMFVMLVLYLLVCKYIAKRSTVLCQLYVLARFMISLWKVARARCKSGCALPKKVIIIVEYIVNEED
jgi:hypothetical protein